MRVQYNLILCLAVLMIFQMVTLASFARHSDDRLYRFMENRGQWDEEILFRAEIEGGYMFYTKNGYTILFYEEPFFDKFHQDNPNKTSDLRSHGIARETNFHTVNFKFLNACEEIGLAGTKAAGSKYNFYLGNDKTRWATNVRSFQEIIYEQVYPGIDMKFYQEDGTIRYDYILKPGADASQIALSIEGADDLSIIEGDLLIATSLRDILETRPVTYQYNRFGGKSEISSHFELDGNVLRFELDCYDPYQDILIDPALVFSTFSGSTADNWGFTAAFDEEGNTYSGGIARLVAGGSIPITTGAFSESFNGGTWDVALYKYDSTGNNLLYGTYLGGNQNEFPHSLIVNHAGDLLILGSTGSANFPVTEKAFDQAFDGGPSASTLKNGFTTFDFGTDIFISRLSNDGTKLIASTYLGGTGNDGIGERDDDILVTNYGDQYRGDIIVDQFDNVYIASNTRSTDFPVLSSFQSTFAGGRRDGIVTRLSPDLSSIHWSTYLGGSDEDVVYSIKLKPDNTVLISGGTTSADLPGTASGLHTGPLGNIDGFVAMISNDGQQLLGSTYLGTDKDDQAYFTDFDSEFNVYVFGQTRGQYPVSQNVFSNTGGAQYIHKLSPDLKSTIFSTVFGSGTTNIFGEIIPDISPTAFLVSECDKLYLSGWGSPSDNFANGYPGLNIHGLPLTSDAFQRNSNNGAFYMAVFSGNADELVFATYFGGSVASAHVDGGTSRFDKRGIVYQSVCSCGGSGDNFPTTPGAWSRTNNSFPDGTAPRCNNAVFKFDLATLRAGIATNSPAGDSPGIKEVCIPSPILFANTSNGGVTFRWDLGDGTIIENEDSVIHAFNKPGSYLVRLRVEDEKTCEQIDEATTIINVRQGEFTVMNDAAICEGTSIDLVATGGDEYLWTPINSNLPAIAGTNATITPDETISYELEATTLDGCYWKDSVEIRVVPLVKSDFELIKDYECMDFPSFKLTDKSAPSEHLFWNMGDGNILEDENPTYKYNNDGEFVISQLTQTEFCIDIKTESVKSELLFLPNVITPNGDASNEAFVIPNDGNVNLSIVNRFGDEVFSSTDYKNNWSADDLVDDVFYYHLIMPDSTQCKGLIHVIR